MPNDSKITTQLAVDDPLVQDSNYKFEEDDRQYIDNQIRGLQQHLVDALIRGRHGSWFDLAGASANVVAGDVVCLASSTAGTVTKAVAAALTNAKAALGVVIQAAAAGGRVFVAFGGIVPPAITGLASSLAGFARANTTTGRLERVTSLAVTDYGIGSIDNAGWIQVCVLLSASGAGAITQDVVTWTPTTSPNSTSQSVQATKDTPDATTASAMVLALTDQSLTDVNATVIGRSSGDAHFAIDLRASYSRVGVAVTERRAPSTTAPLATNPAGWAALLDQTGTDVRVRVTGAAAASIRWSVLANTQIVTMISSAVLDPATLALTGWWRTNFAASPWTPTASVGSSASGGNLTEATNPPVTGAVLNGFTPADFNGTSQLITGANPMSSFVTGTAGSIAVLFNADTAAALSAGVYDDQPIFCDSTANIALGFSSSGVRGGFYDSSASWKMTANVACATGGWHLAQMKWNATTIFVRVDSGAWVSVAATTFFTMTGLPRLGRNYNVAKLDGRIADVLLANTTLADATFDGLIAYVNSRYGLAL